MLDCLQDIRPFESEAVKHLPGNASGLRFNSCYVEYPVVKAQAKVHLQQNTCKWGRCVTLWSSNTTVTAEGAFTANCDLEYLEISMSPNVKLLEPLIEKAEDGAPTAWPEFAKKYPKFREMFCPKETP
jgi:hypothetical protein